jgi:hypothetical protein
MYMYELEVFRMYMYEWEVAIATVD